jgi:hypothetical protein
VYSRDTGRGGIREGGGSRLRRACGRPGSFSSAQTARCWPRRVTRPPPPRTKWTRRVPHPVLIRHASVGRAGRHYSTRAARLTSIETSKDSALRKKVPPPHHSACREPCRTV